MQVRATVRKTWRNIIVTSRSRDVTYCSITFCMTLYSRKKLGLEGKLRQRE